MRKIAIWISIDVVILCVLVIAMYLNIMPAVFLLLAVVMAGIANMFRKNDDLYGKCVRFFDPKTYRVYQLKDRAYWRHAKRQEIGGLWFASALFALLFFQSLGSKFSISTLPPFRYISLVLVYLLTVTLLILFQGVSLRYLMIKSQNYLDFEEKRKWINIPIAILWGVALFSLRAWARIIL